MEGQPNPRQDAWKAEHEALWPAVCKHKLLNGPEKLAWDYLSKATRCGRERRVVFGADVAEAQGLDSSKGNRRLETLAAKGFLRVIDRDKRVGSWLIELLDPPEFEALRRWAADSQGRLFDEDHDDSEESVGSTTLGPSAEPSAVPLGTRIITAEGTSVDPRVLEARPAEPPERGARPASSSLRSTEPSTVPSAARTEPSTEPCAARFTLEDLNAQPHLTLKNLNTLSGDPQSQELGRAAAARTEPSTVPSIGLPPELAGVAAELKARQRALEADCERRRRRDEETAAQHVASPTAAVVARAEPKTQAQVLREVEQLTDEIVRWVACDKMARPYAARIAWAVVEGRLPLRHVHSAKASLHAAVKRGPLNSTRSAYFNGTLKRIVGPEVLAKPQETKS